MPPALTAFIQSWDLLSGWATFIASIGILYLLGVARLRWRGGHKTMSLTRVGFALAGYGALLLAVAGPFEVYADGFFWAHMVQHLLIAMVAAPLILISNPLPAYMWALPRGLRSGAAGLLERRGVVRQFLQIATLPKLALPIFVLIFYAWHVVPFYEAALRNESIHFWEHISMFAGATFFWWPLIGPAPLRSRMGYPLRILYLVAAMTATAALGAIIALADSPAYNYYVSQTMDSGASALADQRLAGVLLWIPGNLIYLLALILTLLRWADTEPSEG